MPALVTAPSAAEESQVLAWLEELARRRTHELAPRDVALQALRVTLGGDRAVRRAALDALVRRIASAHREQITARWTSGAIALRSALRGPLAYRCEVSSRSPLVASCDCPDFLRSSLGLCKHTAAVLARPRVLARSLKAASELVTTVRWDQVRPLTGAGDWLERLRLDPRGGRVRAGIARLFELPLQERCGGSRAAFVTELSAAIARGRVAAEPAIPPLLVREREQLELEASGRELGRGVAHSLKGLRHRLYPYQREGVETFLARGRLLLADDMGLGKTVQAIGAARALWDAGQVKRGLLIVPASLKAQWRREWVAFTDVPIAVLEGNPSERASLLRATRKGFLIANYEQVVRDVEAFIAWGPDLMVLDEAQRMKNWATKTAHSIKRLLPRYRLVLTGTPFENRLDELASLMDWVDDLALEPKWRLSPLHTFPAEDGKKGGGARHLDTLRARLAPWLLRRTKQQVLAQLPSAPTCASRWP